jgi:uncharacterized phage protein (TIGR01671 family)
MREFKFRVWNTYAKEWIDPYWFCISGDGHIYDRVEYATFEKEHHVIQQYVGIKDDHGKDIYEGDIIEVVWRKDHKEQFEIKYEELENCGDCYSDSGFGFNFHMANMNKERNGPDGILGSIKVVGNIFENPELLEDK